MYTCLVKIRETLSQLLLLASCICAFTTTIVIDTQKCVCLIVPQIYSAVTVLCAQDCIRRERSTVCTAIIMKGTKVQTLGVRAVAGVCMVHGWLLGP